MWPIIFIFMEGREAEKSEIGKQTRRKKEVKTRTCPAQALVMVQVDLTNFQQLQAGTGLDPSQVQLA